MCRQEPNVSGPQPSRQLSGNTPQAFSHVGLVNAARYLSDTQPARNAADGMTTDGDEH
jgi:hypothetical protein